MASQKSSPASRVKRTAQSAEIAFQKLRKAILAGEFQEGDLVREVRLVREWKIGRTPLREAIRRAAESGYLVLRPNHAPVVRKLSAEDILQIYVLRELLEGFALECAWDRLRAADLARVSRLAVAARKAKSPDRRLAAQFAFDNALHRLWIDGCGNPWLVSILDRLLLFRPNYQSREVSMLGGQLDVVEGAFAEHETILAAVARRDLRSARRSLREHIDRAGRVLAGLHRSIPERGTTGGNRAPRRRPGKSPVR